MKYQCPAFEEMVQFAVAALGACPALAGNAENAQDSATAVIDRRYKRPTDPLPRLTNDGLSGTIRDMRKATRSSKSFTIDRSILDYLQRTRSSRSRSERVNELLRRAILEEQYEALEREAAEFFAAAGKTERAERKAFAAASHRATTREGV